MERFAVGRPAIREAMQEMQGLGLLEIRQGGRARVKEPSINLAVERLGATMRHLLANSAASLENLKDSRLHFETGMARAAARKRTWRDVRRLVGILEGQRAAQGDLDRFVALDGEFHRAIAAIPGNPIFVAISEGLFQWLADFYRGAVSVPGLEQLTLAEHEGILRAIEAGDEDLAARRMSEHLERANELYRRGNLGAERD